MASFKCFSSMAAIILVTFLLFNFKHCAAANLAMLDSICLQTQDPNFCYSIFAKSNNIANADLNGLGVIAIKAAYSQCMATVDHIELMLENITDPVAVTKITYCEDNYLAAMPIFQDSLDATMGNAYPQAADMVRSGTQKVIDCHNSYRKDNPTATSPVDTENNNMFKIEQIIFNIFVAITN